MGAIGDKMLDRGTIPLGNRDKPAEQETEEMGEWSF